MSSALACVGFAFSSEAEFGRMLKNVYPDIRVLAAPADRRILHRSAPPDSPQ